MQWRESNAAIELPKDVARAYHRLVGIVPPADNTRQALVYGQHMVLPGPGESRPFRWDAETNAFQAPKDYTFDGNSQSWVRLKD